MSESTVRYLVAVRHERYFMYSGSALEASLTPLGESRAKLLVAQRIPSLIRGATLVAHSGYRRTEQMAEMMPDCPVVKAEWTFTQAMHIEALLTLPWDEFETIVGFTHEPTIRSLLELADPGARQPPVGYGQAFRFELDLDAETIRLVP